MKNIDKNNIMQYLTLLKASECSLQTDILL